ncbi:TPA: hypothetical protein NOU44_000232 [Salmonella enterica subsp. enterica serovar Infantis]|nr:hypothetical protein [Salmonella enterica subsp. enterica serovar Infantis]
MRYSTGQKTLGNDCDFPIIEEEANGKLYHTELGKIYKWNEKLECWKQVEAYLASVPTQYGCTTYEEQFTKIINRLGDRLHPERYTKGGHQCQIIDGMMFTSAALLLKSKREKQQNAL